MNKTWQDKQKETIQSGYNRAKELAKEIWIEGDHEGTPNDYYYFECGFVAALNYIKNPDDSTIVDEMNRKMISTKKRLERTRSKDGISIMKPVTIHLDNLDILRDISFAISCVQDYSDTINTNSTDGMKEHDSVIFRIDRLLKFYYQLIGFDYKKLNDQEMGLE